MKNIEIRLWDKVQKEMIYNPELEFTNLTGGDYIIRYLPVPQLSLVKLEDEFILMLYTGLKDDNHKKIFKKDIIVSEKECPDDLFIVEWEEESAGFRMKSPKTGEIMYWPLNDPAVHFFMECKIIGNIYENPELIKV